MAITDIVPESVEAASPAPEISEAPAPDVNALPPEVASLPVIQAVAIGQPAAVLVTREDEDNPAVALIAGAAQELPAAGLALYADDERGVLFNPGMISPQEIALAVKDGTIDKLAMPLGMLEQAMNDLMAEEGGAEGAVASPSGPAVPAAPAGTKRQINAARVQNLKPQAPTAGAKAGQGLVNDLTRPVI